MILYFFGIMNVDEIHSRYFFLNITMYHWNRVMSLLVTRQCLTADRHKNPWRMVTGFLKRPQKQKSNISTEIGFKRVPKIVYNWRNREEMQLK